MPVILDQADLQLVDLLLVEFQIELLFLVELQILVGLNLIFLGSDKLQVLHINFTILALDFVYHLLNDPLVCGLLDHDGIDLCSVLQLEVVNQ